jgi:hypothetical protein
MRSKNIGFQGIRKKKEGAGFKPEPVGLPKNKNEKVVTFSFFIQYSIFILLSA